MTRTTAVLSFLLLTAVAAVAQPNWQLGKPIVTYWAGPAMTEANAKQMAEGNFNLVWCQEQELDNAQKQGVRALLHNGLISPAVLADPAKRAELDALIDRVKNHPAMYAYFIGDEPNSARFPEIGKLFAYLREKDPAHLAYINLFPTYATNEQLGNQGDVVTAYTEHLKQFVAVVKPQLISYDHYHFGVGADGGQYFLNLGLIRDAALQAGVPFLNIIQAATWDPGMRIPHTAEVRFLVNTSLAYGAQGISYYVYCCGGHLGMLANFDGSPTPLYYGLKHPNHDFAAMATQLQPLKSLGAYHAGTKAQGAKLLPTDAPFRLDPPVANQEPVTNMPVEGFVLGYFGPQGGQPTHVVVVNLDYGKPAQTTLVGPGNLQTFNPATGRWTSRGKCRLPLRLQAGGAALVRLAPR